MTGLELLKHYFPKLNQQQLGQLEQLGELYREWNEKINLISRKDIENLYENHIVHALGIAKVINFQPFTQILDVGTGGGLPGIPLAIMFPQARFTLIDSIGKKIKVVADIAEKLQLTNVQTEHLRAEQLHRKIFDFLICRGVTDLTTINSWAKRLVVPGSYNRLDNGCLVLKGGDLTEEIETLNRKVRLYPLRDYFEGEWYAEKYVVYWHAK